MRVILAAMVAVAPLAAWSDEFILPLPVTSAEIFPNAALLSLSGEAQLPAGRHQIRTLLPERTLVQGGFLPHVAGAVLTGVTQVQNTEFDPADFDVPAVVAARATRDADEKAVAALVREADAIGAEIDALDAQADFLRSVTGGDTLARADELVAVAATVARELAALAQARATLDAKLPDLEEQIEDALAELERSEAALRALGPAEDDWLLLTMDVALPTAGPVQVELIGVAEASWSISYEVLLDEAAGRLTLDRTVSIAQFGELPWIDAVVKLSTAEPTSQLAASPVGRSIARILEPRPAASMRSGAFEALDEPMMAPEMIVEDVWEGAATAKIDADGAIIRYDLPDPVTLSPDASAVQVALGPLAFEADPYLMATPRRDETAFVMADFTNDAVEPILPGDAFIYRGSTLIGQERLPLIAAGAEETLGFGPERSVALEIQFLDRQEGDRGIIRGQETREEAIRLTARNLGDEARDVRLRYAVPTSQQEDLKITVDMAPAPSTRDVGDLLGVMEWDLALDPGAEKAIDLNFDLRWPEGQELGWRP